MAKHYNDILIARGLRSKFENEKDPIYGELFYDKSSHGLYIGNENKKFQRFGGFDSIVVKGTVQDSTFKTVAANAEPGDAYLVTGSISARSYDLKYNGDGTVAIKSSDTFKYDDFYKAGQVVIFVGTSEINGTDGSLTNDILIQIPNSYSFTANTITNNNGVVGAIVLSGTADAVDLEYAPDQTDVALTNEIRDVQSALDYLFNNKIEYKGPFNTIEITAGNYNTYTTTEATLAAIWKDIANIQKLQVGEMVVYNGPSKRIDITLADSEDTTPILLRTNTLVINDNGVIATIPLGVSDAQNSDVQLTGNRANAGTDIATFTTIDRFGTKQNGQTDTDIDTVQNAIDMLHQTKADLTTSGKVPLSQIPSTMIGALQYIGTLSIPNDGTWKDTMTSIEFATLMGAVKGGWEKSGEGNSSLEDALVSAEEAYNSLDEGDYVIVSIDKTSENNENKAITTEITITDPTSGETLFRVSNGDHIIINAITQSSDTITSVTLDHLNSSAAVDAVNGMQGSVWIEDSVKTATNKDGTSKDIQDVVVTTDGSNYSIKLNTPNAVAEDEVIDATYIPQATGNTRTLIKSEIKITDSSVDDGSNTKLTAQKVTEVDGTNTKSEVTIEFPDEDGKIAVVKLDDDGKPMGNNDIVAKFDETGNVYNSEISQVTDGNTGHLYLGVKDPEVPNVASLTINYDQLPQLIQYNSNSTKITRRFDDNKASSHANRELTDTNTFVMLDTDSTIDGGEWV